ncbi:MAG: hypothetical protein ACI9HK_001618 [Pirellulaceae bacterium]|jgi:hypothetical protein
MTNRRWFAIHAVLVLVSIAGCSTNQPTVDVSEVNAKPAKVYPSIPPTTRVTDLHYPNYGTLEEAVEDSEQKLTMGHYRRALQKADPNEHYPDRAAAARAYARPSAKDGSLDRGVVVDVDLWSVEALESQDAS